MDTKGHWKNAPRVYVSPSLADAFCRFGISDVKTFLTNIAYGNSIQDNDGALISSLKQENACLLVEITRLRAANEHLKGKVGRLEETIRSLREMTKSWHDYLGTKLQEIAQMSYDYGMGFSLQAGALEPLAEQ